MCDSTELDAIFDHEIERIASDTLRYYLRYVLRNANRSIGVDRVAAELSVSRQHLARLCRAAGLPKGPLWYLSMARLLSAARRLDRVDEKPSWVAEQLQFGETSDLYTMFRRYTARSVPELRAAGIWRSTKSLYQWGLTPLRAPRSNKIANCSNEVVDCL